MSEARLADETFERDAAFELHSYARRSFSTFQEKPAQVILRSNAVAAHDASSFAFHPDQSIEENGDGSLAVRFEAGGIDEMCWRLFTGGASRWRSLRAFGEGWSGCVNCWRYITDGRRLVTREWWPPTNSLVH